MAVGRLEHVGPSDRPESGPRVASGPEVVIWEADGRAASGGYGRPIARRLVRSGFSVVTVPLPERAPTEVELGAPFHVLSGGDTAVDADVSWLVAARERLAWVLDRSLAGKASVTGICFGAQLLAHVIAGPEATGEHPDGMQAGLYELRAEQPDAVSSFHYHRIRREVILAAGAEVTLDSDRTEVQAFRFGDNVRGVQFHPELSPTALWRTLRAYRDVLDRHGVGAAPVESSIRSRRASWSERPWFEFVERPAGDAQLSAA